MSTIAEMLEIDRRTVKKYKTGNPNELCILSRRSGLLSNHTSLIVEMIRRGKIQAEILDLLKSKGYKGTDAYARMYINFVAKRYGITLEKNISNTRNHYKKNNNKLIPNKRINDKSAENIQIKDAYISRKGVFNHIWMGINLTGSHKKYIWNKYPLLFILDNCVKEFRNIFFRKNMPQLYLFIEKYKKSTIPELSSFAKGLEKDICAVENSVASKLSNGFVEGTNSKLKMVKRTMYGRCSKLLLEAKLLYHT